MSVVIVYLLFHLCVQRLLFDQDMFLLCNHTLITAHFPYMIQKLVLTRDSCRYIYNSRFCCSFTEFNLNLMNNCLFG